MHVARALTRWLEEHARIEHKARSAALVRVVAAALGGAKLSLTHLGRGRKRRSACMKSRGSFSVGLLRTKDRFRIFKFCLGMRARKAHVEENRIAGRGRASQNHQPVLRRRTLTR